MSKFHGTKFVLCETPVIINNNQQWDYMGDDGVENIIM